MEHISEISNTATLLVSIISLLMIANFTFYFSKKINFPYTLLLVLVGILLIPISNLSQLHFLRQFELSKDVLFYIFLPVLLFEAAYNIHYRGLLKNIKAISFMAIGGLLISTLIIGFSLFFILPYAGLAIPLSVTMLFGAIISATDPVAVVALFKEYGAPKRLGLLFEGESLFNDGTAVAMFVVILGVIAEHNGVFSAGVISEGFIVFLSLIGFGIIFGLLMGYIFSKLMGLIKNENVQITFSLLSAHLTFILSELITEEIKIGNFDIHISGIISTVMAALVIGNFGRYKLSPKAESYTNKFWHYFAFVSNSFVFILLGLLFYKIKFDSLYDLAVPALIAIVVTAVARAVSVYAAIVPLNILKLEQKIPTSWMTLLSWGSLRGSLAIIMVLMIPDDLVINNWPLAISIKDFIFILVSTSIIFTLFIKGLTIGKLMKKLKLDSLEELESFEYFLGKANTYTKVISYIKEMYSAGRMTEEEFYQYLELFNSKINKQKNKITQILENHPEYLKKSMKYFALGVERSMLKKLYQEELISERGYKKYRENILQQKEILGEKKNPMAHLASFAKSFFGNAFSKDMTKKELYLYYRALAISSSQVIKELGEVKNDNYISDKSYNFDKLISEYEEYLEKSNAKKMDLVENDKEMMEYRKHILEEEIYKKEDVILSKISENDFITSKLNLILHKEFKEHTDD